MDKLIAMAASTICAAALTMSACASRADPPAAAADGEFVDVGYSDAAGLRSEFATTVGDRVFFEVDRFALTPRARATLSRQAEWLSRRGLLGVVIAGNCDRREALHDNVDLAARRMDAVFGYLSTHGIAFIRIRKVSYGKDRPLDPGTSEAAMARNRSAQIILIGLASR
jgi:peptidoglycan-associated lipoprotein